MIYNQRTSHSSSFFLAIAKYFNSLSCKITIKVPIPRQLVCKREATLLLHPHIPRDPTTTCPKQSPDRRQLSLSLRLRHFSSPCEIPRPADRPQKQKTDRHTSTHITMADTHTYKFNVSMSCSGCSGAVDRVLKKLDGEPSPFPAQRTPSIATLLRCI